MGLETILMGGLIGAGLGLSAAGMASSNSSAKKQAEALKKEGELKATERARETNALAAAQKVSFLNSGISLTGEDDTPMGVLTSTFRKGKEDIGQIKDNYDTQIENVYSQARTQLLSGLGSLSLGMGKLFS